VDRSLLRILVATNQALLCQALSAYLRAELPMAWVDRAACGAAALAQLRALRWDVLVLDTSLGDMNGLDVLQVVHHDFPRLPVVMVSIHTHPLIISRCLQAGAWAYVTKDEAAPVVVTIIRELESGGRLGRSRILKNARKYPRKAPRCTHRARNTTALEN
jgi:two-component system, NarL family, invasion response regulator UvrY